MRRVEVDDDEGTEDRITIPLVKTFFSSPLEDELEEMTSYVFCQWPSVGSSPAFSHPSG